MDGRRGRDKNQQTRKAGNADCILQSFQENSMGIGFSRIVWDTQTEHLNNPQLNQKGCRDVQTLHRKVFRIQVLVVGSSVLAGTQAWIARAERLSSQRTTLLPCCSLQICREAHEKCPVRTQCSSALSLSPWGLWPHSWWATRPQD